MNTAVSNEPRHKRRIGLWSLLCLIALCLVAAASTGHLFRTHHSPQSERSAEHRQRQIPVIEIHPDSQLYFDLTKDSSDICALHRKFMVRTKVPVIGYGWIGSQFVDSPYPHGGQPADSGCISPSEHRHAIKWVCSLCKQEWELPGRPEIPPNAMFQASN